MATPYEEKINRCTFDPEVLKNIEPSASASLLEYLENNFELIDRKLKWNAVSLESKDELVTLFNREDLKLMRDTLKNILVVSER